MSVNEALGKSSGSAGVKPRKRIPQEVSILIVLAGISLLFELLGWPFKGQSFLLNADRLSIVFLQTAVSIIIARWTRPSFQPACAGIARSSISEPCAPASSDAGAQRRAVRW